MCELAKAIKTGEYRHGGYKESVISEKKQRRLAVARVRDRLVHRLVYDRILPLFEPGFDFDVWSCRKGKGLHACLLRTQKLLLKYPDAYVWRADVTKFFDHVDHEILMTCLKRKISNRQTAWLCQEIIDSFTSGIPIGNLTSQIFANIYLHEFDRFVRHTLKPLAYVRYGDDFVVFVRRAHETQSVRRRSFEWLSANLKLTINPKNDVAIRASRGLYFLGHIINQEKIEVDPVTTKLVLEKVNFRNLASYKSLKLGATASKKLSYQVLDELDI